MKIADIALDNFNTFKKFEGSDHIATVSSQINLLEILRTHQVDQVMDFGAGIGTLTSLVIKHTNVNLTAIEKNEFCIKQFTKHNLPNNRITLLGKIPRYGNFDLVIIDDAIKTSEIFRLFYAAKNVIVFIEGRRSSTIARLSFYSIFFRMIRKFQYCPSRLNLFGSNEIEKGGSSFVFNKGTLLKTVITWMQQLRKTGELNQIKFFIAKIWLRIK